MTAQCALCMGALKIFKSPWVYPRLLFRKFCVPIDPMNVHTEFEVRSFTHSWDDKGYLKVKVIQGH